MLEILIQFAFICVPVLAAIFFFLRIWDRASGETAVTRKLESLQKKDEHYRSFNNVILKTPDGTTQIDHILISPHGVFVIETKNFTGWIFGEANQRKWTQSLCGPGYASIKYPFQNPIHQNYKHVKAVQNFLGIDAKFIFNLVVFAGNSEFKTAMPKNVIELRDFIRYIETHTEILFNVDQTNALAKKLNEYVEQSSFNEEMHIKNLMQNREHPICPKCGKLMVRRTARKGSKAGSEFWGCPNYPSCRMIKHVA